MVKNKNVDALQLQFTYYIDTIYFLLFLNVYQYFNFLNDKYAIFIHIYTMITGLEVITVKK